MTYSEREAQRKKNAQQEGRWPSHRRVGERPKNSACDLDPIEVGIIYTILEDFVEKTIPGSANDVSKQIALAFVQDIMHKIERAG